MIGKTITKATPTTSRYACHFLNFIRGEEAGNVMNKYERAIKLANQIGGRKSHNKQYGEGLVFQSYNLQSTVDDINRVAGTSYTSYEVV